MKSRFGRLIILLLLMVTFMAMGSCSIQRMRNVDDEDVIKEEKDNGQERDENDDDDDLSMPTPEESGPESTQPPDETDEPSLNDDFSGKIVKHEMSEVGLEPIPISSLNGVTLNPRIAQFVARPSYHELADYTDGIDYLNDKMIIAPRFSESIIGNVKIGTSLKDVTKALGTPSFQENDILVYRTDVFYIAFMGETKVEYAAIKASPRKEYNEDILYDLLAELNSDSFTSLMESIEKVDPNGDFFDDSGFINGGGYYANSIYGINVTDFDDRIIDVFNNFQGNLYALESPDITFGQSFMNLDAVVLKLRDALYGYEYTDSIFEKEGVLSPDGKLKAVYEWVYSMDQHFIVRALDFSIQDRYIYVPTTEDFYWLNNHVLLYVDFYTTVPMAIDVNMSMPEGKSILEMAGLLTQEEIDDGVNFTIVRVEKNVITVKDTVENKTYSIKYEIGADGVMKFELK